MFGNALCTYIVVPITSGFPSWPFSTPVENVQAALRFFAFALLIWVSVLKRCRSDVRPVIVHSPAPWPTAGAVTSTSKLAASPPDHSLKRFIADLMLRMRGVKKNGPDKPCPSESRDPRDSGGPAFPTGDNHRPTPSTPGLLLGIEVISRVTATVNQPIGCPQSPG